MTPPCSAAICAIRASCASRSPALRAVLRLFWMLLLPSISSPPGLVAQAVPVGEAFDVNQFVTGFQSHPQVGMSDSGAAVFAWDSQEQDGNGRAVVARKVAANGSLFNEFLVNQTTAGEQDIPSLAMNASGDFAITWRNGPNTGRAIAMRSTVTNGSSLTSETQANTVAGNILRSVVCRFADDTTLVAWESGSLRFRTFAANGDPLTAEQNLPAFSQLARFQVACLADHRWVAVWQESDGDGFGITGLLVDDLGAVVGQPFQVNEDEANDQFLPVVGSDGGRYFTVAWRDDGVDLQHLELRRFFVGPAAAAALPTAIAGDQEFELGQVFNLTPQNLEMASDGAFVVAFEISGQPAVRALEFSRTGAVLPGGPISPGPVGESASAIDAGVGLREFLLVWEENGTSLDIRAGRYVRRALFSDDFEPGDTDAWSDVAD